MKIVNSAEKVKRSIESGTEKQRQAVTNILQQVKEGGDQAVLNLTEKYDGVKLSSYNVSNDDFREAYQQVDDELVEIIREAADHIRDFHSRQTRQSWMTPKQDGTILGQKVTPLDAAGVYVPGGTAAYPSSLLMGVIPAKVAGVKRVIVTTPPVENGKLPPAVLVAAKEAGVDEIYKVGGAQAVGAMAYGTESIHPVDKIVGPGNIFVALAKREVFGFVDIDSIAGPSEIAVLADDTASPRYVAADLLSQAEHDPRSSAVLVTPSRQLAEQVPDEVEKQQMTLPRKEITRQSLNDYGCIYVVESLESGIELINDIAPEHLEILTADAMGVLGKIRHAGAIFIGPYSSEPVGDYFAGPNHVLPTSGTARFSSPLTIDDFTKVSSVISYSQEALEANGEKMAKLARLEGLEAHARAVEVRLEEDDK